MNVYLVKAIILTSNEIYNPNQLLTALISIDKHKRVFYTHIPGLFVIDSLSNFLSVSQQTLVTWLKSDL